MIIKWHQDAKDEADFAAAFYKEQQLGLEQRFLDNLEEALHRIQRNPLLYRTIFADIRKCKIHRFPLAIIFRLRDDDIEIVAVMHVRRKPGYWVGRVK